MLYVHFYFCTVIKSLCWECQQKFEGFCICFLSSNPTLPIVALHNAAVLHYLFAVCIFGQLFHFLATQCNRFKEWLLGLIYCLIIPFLSFADNGPGLTFDLYLAYEIFCMIIPWYRLVEKVLFGKPKHLLWVEKISFEKCVYDINGVYEWRIKNNYIQPTNGIQSMLSSKLSSKQQCLFK